MPQHPEYQYLNLLTKLMETGNRRLDRTGVGTKALFGEQLRFDLAQGFPVFSTKKTAFRIAWVEMLWMLSGSTSLRPLLQHKAKIWTDWPLKKYRETTSDYITQEKFEQRILDDDQFAEKWGDLGPVYGKQWRRWKTADGREVDQVQEVLNLLKNNPTSRRILWEGWNVGELGEMALPPCHKHYQFFVRGGKLDGAIVQRSADVFLGVPFNICNLALVTHLLAAQSGLEPGEIVWFGLDVHLYANHEDAARQQLRREPRPFPQLVIKHKRDSLFAYQPDDLELTGYDPHPAIKAEIAV